MYDLYPDDAHSAAHLAASYPPPNNTHSQQSAIYHNNSNFYYAPTPPTTYGLFDAPQGHPHSAWPQATADDDHFSTLSPVVAHAMAGNRGVGLFGSSSDAGRSEDDSGFVPPSNGKRPHARPPIARSSSSAVLRQVGGPTPPPPGMVSSSSSSALAPPRSSRASKGASSGGSGPGTPAYLAPDYTLNPAGPASSSTTSFKCPHEGCEKVYKGKHARSIWRRHLQDKHGIPLAQQPRRTRWDNDANRPKSEEERRARTLDSKRRWARKHRAEINGGERDGSVETSLGGSARGGSVDVEPEGWEMEDDDEDVKDVPLEDEPEEREQPTTSVPEPSTSTHAIEQPWRQWRTAQPPPPVPYKEEDEPRRPLVHRDTNTAPPYPLEFATYGHSSAAAQAGSPSQYAPSHQYQHQMYYPHPPNHQPPPLGPPPQEPEFYHRTTYSPRHSFAPASPRYNNASYYHNPIPPQHAPAPMPVAHPTQKDAAALVLLNLKTGCSSPSSPMVTRRETADDDESADPDTSIESNLSFSFDESNRTIRRASSSPTSSNHLRDDDSSEILLQRHALKRPPPPLPSMLESYAGLGTKRFRNQDEYGGAFATSLVRTPTPATRRAMPTGVAQAVGEDDDDTVLGDAAASSDGVERGRSRSEEEDDDHQDEDGDLDDDEVRHASPTRAFKCPPLVSASSSAALANDLDAFAIASSDSDRAMPPPHPGSSSSVSSFHLSTPVGPAQGRHARYDTFTRPFFPSSANSTSEIDRYYSTHLSMAHQQSTSSSSTKAYHSRAPMGLSSPPGGSYSSYLFSSPAHPGISKQLGLTAQPGPGVLSGASGTPGRESGEGVKGWSLEDRTLPGIRELEKGVGLGGGRRYSD
ncbi:hypothetical protein P7C70_g7465, partial [Phenoliferia sp. Uapishka_3]